MFWLCHVAYGILVSQTGIEQGSLAVEAQNPKHWTTRELPENVDIVQLYLFFSTTLKNRRLGRTNEKHF